MKKRLTLDLSGNFRLSDETGAELPIRTARVRAMIATLACSRDRKRSRSWLQTCLWEHSSEKQASGSMRQALSGLRKALGCHADLLETDRTYVSIPSLTLTRGNVASNDTFFEDAPDLGEVFEDWLRLERATVAATAREENGDVTAPDRFCIVMTMPRILSDDPVMPVLAALICDRILDGLRAYGLVDLFDLRDLRSNQLGRFPEQEPPRPDAALQVRMMGLGDDRHVTTTLFQPQGNRVLWTQSQSLGSSKNGAPPTMDWLQEITSRAIEAIPTTLFPPYTAPDDHGVLHGGRSLFAAAHQLLGISPHGHLNARAILRRQIDRSKGSAIVHAWHAFSFANGLSECEDEPDADFFEEAAEHCAHALERDPSNGLVLALIAHVYGFVLRRQDVAFELAELARRAAPDIPLVWDLSAMNAIYRDQPETGFAYSNEAQRLGRFSPYKPLFDSSVSISATLTGRHRLAIETARSLLQRQSGFLAAMRYLSASLVAEGQIDEARQVIGDIRARDPNFNTENICSQDYPLPSAMARDAIGAALSRV